MKTQFALEYINPDIQDSLHEASDKLFTGTGIGSEMTKWLYWPEQYLHSDEYIRLKNTAKAIRASNAVVLVIGIGGSYLGTRAVIEAEYGAYYNESCAGPFIYYLGCDLSPDKLNRISEIIDNKSFSIIYISKSGGTIEPALTFRFFYSKLLQQYGKDADKRVFAITGKGSSILRNLTIKHNWENFEVPEGIGGRYSVLTAVGLLPIAVAGINTDKILEGAIEAMNDTSGIFCAQHYALFRNTYYNAGYRVEFFALDSPELQYLGEWLKQLFAESEGKDFKGIWPTSGVFPTDLHSIGQYLQQGTRNLIFETQIIRDAKKTVKITEGDFDDNLEYLGKTFNDAANATMFGAATAHADGGIPVGKFFIGNTLADLGYLLQVMMTACAISAYMLGVNPFDQPGVEQHKIAMKNTLSAK